MTRLYERAPRGERVTESVPRNYGAQTSLISSISLAGVEATMSIEGTVDTEVFNAYVEQVLRPAIRAGSSRVRGDGSVVVDVFAGLLANRADVVKDQSLYASS